MLNACYYFIFYFLFWVWVVRPRLTPTDCIIGWIVALDQFVNMGWIHLRISMLHQKISIWVLCGRALPSLLTHIPNNLEGEIQLLNMDKNLTRVKFYMAKAHERIKQNYDRERRELDLQVGQWVYIQIQPYKQHSILSKINLKLALWFTRPYKIVNKINAVASKVQLQEDAKIHDTFHISILKPVLSIFDKALKEPYLKSLMMILLKHFPLRF